MSTRFDSIRTYYAGFNEWDRLDTPEGTLELQRALGLLKVYLKPQRLILDLGGGPGRYTVALAQQGHRIHLADLSPNLLEIAKRKVEEYKVSSNVNSFDEVNATDLSEYENDTFDAVLAFGPFYHLTVQKERESAAQEIWRVLKEDGFLFAAFIPKLSGLSGVIDRGVNTGVGAVTKAIFRKTFQAGIYRNTLAHGFQEGYFALQREIEELFGSHGFTTCGIHSLRGIAAGKAEFLMKIKEQNLNLYEEIINVIEETSQDSSVIDFGGHAVYIGRKPL